MNRKPRNLNDREPSERQWLIENTWCDQCNAADIGIMNPSEYEEDGHVFVEGNCPVCGTIVSSEIIEANDLKSSNVDNQLIDEIRDQLEADVLHFAWMVQIARLQNPDRSESDNIRAVIDSLIKLHGQGEIVVGNARNIDGVVMIDKWCQSGRDLRTRIESAIDESNSRDREFCFWIQLTKHFTR